MERLVKVSFDVGYDFIFDLDDILTFDYELTPEEFNDIVQIEKKEIWNKGHEEWDDIRCYLPKLFVKLKAKAIEEGYMKWGNNFVPSDKDYQYEIFIPDEIWDEVVKTPEYKRFRKAKKRMKKMSERRWHLECNWVEREIRSGRWAGFIPIDEMIDGRFERSGKDAYYNINVKNVCYEKVYTLRSSEIRIELNPLVSEEKVRAFIALVLQKCSRVINYEFVNGSSWRLTTKSNEDNSDIKIFATLLDYIFKIRKE